MFSIFNIKKKTDKNTPTRDNEDCAVDDPSPININNSSIPEPDAPNNIQPEHSGITTLSDSFQLDLGDLESGPTQRILNVNTKIFNKILGEIK